MKKLRQFIKELPSKKVVFAFGRFQPPTTGHELLVNAVKKIAAAQGADHIIFASRTEDKKGNPLPVARKVYYLNRMFPHTNFVAANAEIRTFMEAAKMLSGKYKNLVMVAGSDRVPEYKKLLDKYNGSVFNFDTIEVVSAGERDPDADSASGMSGTKMREAAKRGDFNSFKKGLPNSLTELDGKRLMNEVRVGMGIEVVKEHVKFETSEIREKYVAGKIFAIGDMVTDGTSVFEVVDRGANYISVTNESGDVSKKWLDSVQPIVVVSEDIQPGPAPDEISYKGYTTKNFHKSTDAAKAFKATIERTNDPVAVLNALKATDTYMGINDRVGKSGAPASDTDKQAWAMAHEKARESLNNTGEFMHHADYWHMHQHELEGMLNTYKDKPDLGWSESTTQGITEMKFAPSDKLKVARIVASSLGVVDVDEKSGPETMINQALHAVKNKRLTPEAWKIIGNMLNMASDAGIKYDATIVKKQVSAEAVLSKDHKNNESDHDVEAAAVSPETSKVGHSLGSNGETNRRMKIKHMTEGSEDQPFAVQVGPTVTEDEHDLSDEDIDTMVKGVQDDDFLEAYDDEELYVIDDDTGEQLHHMKEEVIMEVLSRAERIRAKVRFAKTEAKRERRTRVALKTRSSVPVINKRARRLAINMMRQRLAKKPLDKLSIGEKERIEAIIARRKQVIDRIAMKMVPRVRKVENDRLIHHKFTKA